MPSKKKIDDPISYLENFFSSDPNMINLFNALVSELAESLQEQSKNTKVTYGINMTIENGNPATDSSNARLQEKIDLDRASDPFVEVISDSKKITIIAEVPGAAREEIRADYSPEQLVISTNNADSSKKYFKQIKLPEHSGSSKIGARYTNGVLEVIVVKGKKINKKNDIKID